MKYGRTRKGTWVKGYYYEEDNQKYIITQYRDIYTSLIIKEYIEVVEIRDNL